MATILSSAISNAMTEPGLNRSSQQCVGEMNLVIAGNGCVALALQRSAG